MGPWLCKPVRDETQALSVPLQKRIGIIYNESGYK